MLQVFANWHWPQWIYLVLILLKLLIVAAEHGKPMLEADKVTVKKYNFPGVLVGTIITLLILAAGGFFG